MALVAGCGARLILGAGAAATGVTCGATGFLGAATGVTGEARGKYLTLTAARDIWGIPSLMFTALWKSRVHFNRASLDDTVGGLALTYAVAWSLHSLHGSTSANVEKNLVALSLRSSVGATGNPAAA